MSLRMPKKIPKMSSMSLSRDNSSSNDADNNNPPAPKSNSSPSMRKFSVVKKQISSVSDKISSASDKISSASDNAKKSLSSEMGVDYQPNTRGGGLDYGSPGGISGSNHSSARGGAGGGGGAKPMGRSEIQQPFETSEGAMRLNRILDSSSSGGMVMSRSVPVGGMSHGASPLPGHRTKTTPGKAVTGIRKGINTSLSQNSPGGVTAKAASALSNSSAAMPSMNNNNNTLALSASSRRKIPDYIPPSTIQLADSTDERAVGEMTCRISSKMRVDVRSIGGGMLSSEGKVEARTGNVLLREGWEELLENKDDEANNDGEAGDKKFKNHALSAVPTSIPTRPMNQLTNESLFSMCVSQFDLSVGLSGGPSGGKKRHIPITKSRNKLRYIVLVRSTNRPLLRPRALGIDGSGLVSGSGGLLDDDDDDDTMDNDDDLGSDDGYDNMYNPDPSTEGGAGTTTSSVSSDKKKKKRGQTNNKGDAESVMAEKKKSKKKLYEEYDCGIPFEREISSFPALFCLAIHADGTKPDVRKILELDKLVSIENTSPRKNSPPGSAGNVVLVFRNGDAVEIDCDLPNAGTGSGGASSGGGNAAGGTTSSSASAAGKKNTAIDTTNRLRKERFLWSLLQVHAILCTSVVEQSATAAALARGPGGSSRVMAAGSAGQLPPLVVRNVDRGELQYVSTVNSFLTDSPVLCSLLDRQSNRSGRIGAGAALGGGKSDNAQEKKSDNSSRGIDGIALSEEGKSSENEMDGMAYDMMMGNYNRRVALFVSDDEKREAADVLNATAWQQQEITVDGASNIDASATAESLIQMLQQRMRDLEAETCRRLISWEDEKYYSALGEQQRPVFGEQVSEMKVVDAMSVNDLFKTLQNLDDELEQMESWIQDRATIIKPITDECCGIEEENRMLEQQWVSYETLGSELKRLLGGLVLPPSLLKVLENPGSVIVYDRSGAVDISRSEQGVELIHQAGQALKLAIDTAEGQGGIYLRAVSDTVKVLSTTSNKFCGSLARIVVTVMEQLAKEVCLRPEAMIGKGDTHTSIAKKIRETQRQFQASLLAYIKIIEVLALLKPDILPAVRDAYSELVAEGIMSKKRMKFYFASLPGRTSVKLAHDVNFDGLAHFPGRTSSASMTHDLSEYAPVSLRHPNAADTSGIMKPVNVEDIEAALSEMLPLIAREAYFTAALFGLSSRHLDGRQKKRNFEAAKKSVDNSSQYFRYYINRICGIASELDAEGKKVKGDAMLSLVASIHLNESMDGYVDRNKKGGDHSLSLAYVRATILDLRKKVDKQWVIWVEDQIKWIRTNPGVPPNGKRAGIFASIARLPAYLDHGLICCKAGRPKDYTPNLAKIKVVSYYLQKMASALFASLNECAERETTDQQYAANVMRMENSYFFTQSIKQRGIELTTLFQKQITGASVICKQSTDAYLGWMIKREFKAMHSLFSNISRIRKDVGDADVPIHVPRAQFVRTLQKESSKEIMKEKIGVVYARMEKHLSESGGLLPVAWKALVKVLYEWFGRWEKLSTSCYKFILEPSAIDVVRIAKSASGSAASSGKRTIEGRPEKHKYVSI
eukprot:CAMPEP_0172305044 /NCGR_PEP_ID=MMETSP1058-20130122/6363_1 /TAXON_ID=83371 /ORGANISM="Detonula confervacea, Strain CCMP 353" /LENGTH=1564 /DNA_ID=CAMNT_0013016491 /DNA_START=221 /DNA_END=4915 /DNA_ORIENTATION=+